MSEVLTPPKPKPVTLEALENYLRARDAYVEGLSELEKATLRLQKERFLASLIEGKRRG